jgi:tRNA (cmo5U34)-methyltransferase
MSDKSRDQLFAQPRDMIVDFVFDENVVRVFPDMIRRSVPGYESIIMLLGLFAREYAQANTQLYDLGCSTGAATLALRRRLAQPGCRIIAVDNSAPMVAACQQNIDKDTGLAPVEVLCADIQELTVHNASVIVLNFTLQFIAPPQRPAFLQKLSAGLNPGGVLLLAEKICFTDPVDQHFQESLQLAFKKANGYSDLEISQKRTALEKILIPESIERHRARLLQCGFAQVHVWFSAFNFVALAAIK